MKIVRQFIEKHRDLLLYLIFGLLTTAVNLLIYFHCYHVLGFSAGAGNGIAWVGAVIFAYLTNKPLVFRSHDWSAKTLLPELFGFVTCRLGSGVLETAVIWLTVDRLGWDGDGMKLLTGVLVVAANYASSKLLIFRKKEDKGSS